MMRGEDFPSGPEATAAFLERLVFSDEPVPADQVPPRLAPGEDIVITAAVRPPLQFPSGTE
ncbi:hypothetical protein JMUB6875_76400 [Nocardia sp. JMUB6875]